MYYICQDMFICALERVYFHLDASVYHNTMPVHGALQLQMFQRAHHKDTTFTELRGRQVPSQLGISTGENVCQLSKSISGAGFAWIASWACQYSSGFTHKISARHPPLPSPLLALKTTRRKNGILVNVVNATEN